MEVGITGHQSIPENAVRPITSGITQTLSPYGNRLIGLSSLAAGADQLFSEIVLQMGGHLRVIVPCANYEAAFSDEDARIRFRRFLNKATTIETLSYPRPSEEAFLAAGRRIVDLSQLLIAVWDGRKARGKGGTADIVRYARKKKVQVVVIWPIGVKR